MRVKFMIHRSKGSFLKEQEIFKQIFQYYSLKYKDIRINAGKVKMSIIKGMHRIDFDYGYYNMKRRDFKAYDYIISTGLCAILNPEAEPGDLFFPQSSSRIGISKDKKRISIQTQKTIFSNKMTSLFERLKKFEENTDTGNIKSSIKSIPGYNEYLLTTLKDMKIHPKAKMITCNKIFIPSELTGSRLTLKTSLQEYLETNADALNCESWDMMKTRKPILMLSWGLDKPYHTNELSKDLRDGKNLKMLVPTFNPAQKTYFYFMLIGYILSRNFQVINGRQ